MPRSRNTTGSGAAFTSSITASVNVSHPFPWCDPGSPSRTVSTAFRSSTPRRAHGLRSPASGEGTPRSSSSSASRFRSDGGFPTPGGTENASPWAWPGP